MIRRAILDFALYKDADSVEDAAHYQLAVDAAEWLFFDGGESINEAGRYTFLYICDLLGLDPRRIRDQALKLTAVDLQRFSGNAGDG
jgi:hypothetical protein